MGTSVQHFIFDLFLLVLKKFQLDVAVISLAAIVYALHGGLAALPVFALAGILLLRFAVWLPIFYRMWTAREGREARSGDF